MKSLLTRQPAGQTDGDELKALHQMSGISSRHFLKLVEDRGQVGFWSMDLETGDMRGSAGLYRLLGLEASPTMNFTDLVRMMHPGDQSFNLDMLAIIRSGQAVEREFRIIRQDKTLRWMQNKAEVIVDAKGIAIRALGLMTDVTQQHEARASVEEGWQSYQSLISAIAAVRWRISPDGKITSLVNWEELSGQTLEEADYGGWADVIHPDERDAALALWEETAATGEPCAIDVRIRCVDGIYRRYLVRGAPVLNSDGTVREWIGVLIKSAPVSSPSDERHSCKIVALDVAHIRAARALLNWSIEDLAEKADVSISTIQRLERGVGKRTMLNHAEAIRQALEKGGARFGFDDHGGTTISLVTESAPTRQRR